MKKREWVPDPVFQAWRYGCPHWLWPIRQMMVKNEPHEKSAPVTKAGRMYIWFFAMFLISSCLSCALVWLMAG
jgi:hypothetical protein